MKIENSYKHIPVMLNEVLEYLNPLDGGNFIDCTLGGGGYTMAISEKVGNRGFVLAIDLDRTAIKNSKELIEKRKIKNIKIAYGNFKDLLQITKKYLAEPNIASRSKGKENKMRIDRFDGIVFDLGLSSYQLQDRSRGFSFQLDAPLDMKFNGRDLSDKSETEYIVNKWKQENLEDILRKYGEERFAKRIARELVSERKKNRIKTTRQLVEIIKKAVPSVYRNKKIHFATKTFQALRIATNKELDALEEALPQSLDILKKSGRIVVVSYHSLEDRIVKNFFRKESRNCICPPKSPICQCGHKAKLKILTKKVIIPTDSEIKKNPRSRSARLRVAVKI